MQSEVKVVELPALKIIVTGNGRVSHGAQHFLDEVGIKQVSPREFLEQEFEFPVYTVAKLPDTVCRKIMMNLFLIERNFILIRNYIKVIFYVLLRLPIYLFLAIIGDLKIRFI